MKKNKNPNVISIEEDENRIFIEDGESTVSTERGRVENASRENGELGNKSYENKGGVEGKDLEGMAEDLKGVVEESLEQKKAQAEKLQPEKVEVEGGQEKNTGQEQEKAHKENSLTEDLEKAKADYLYLRAEFDNYRKQVSRDRSNLVRYGNENLIVALLEVVDVFERALETEVTPETIASLKRGLK